MLAPDLSPVEGDGPTPDLRPADDLWEEEHYATRRRRRRLALGGAMVAGLALALMVAAVVAARPPAQPEAIPTTVRPDAAGPRPDPGAVDLLASFGRGLRARAAGLAASSCSEPEVRVLRCTYRAGPVVARATFRAVGNAEEGRALLDTRLVGATSVSRVVYDDGEAATFRLALGSAGSLELPWVAWYSERAGLYAEVSTTDETAADLPAFHADQSGR